MCAVVLTGVCLFVSPGRAGILPAGGQVETHQLELGQPIEREMKGGEIHVYRVSVASGQLLRVVVHQRGIDVVVSLIGPDGQQILEIDGLRGEQGPEPVSVVTEITGTYLLKVGSPDSQAVPGRYQVKIEALREPTLQDRSQIAAERASGEAVRLYKEGTAESVGRAAEKFEESLPHWRAVEDRQGEVDALVGAGYMYHLLGEYQKALEYYNQALPLTRALGDRIGELTILNNIAVVYQFVGDLQRALELHRQILPLHRTEEDRAGKAETLNSIGGIYDQLGEPQKALEHYDQALAIRRTIGDHGGEAETLNNIAVVYDNIGEPQKALEYYDQALPLFRRIGDMRGEAYTLHNIGRAYHGLGDLQRALEYLNQALPLLRTTGDRRGEGSTLDSLGLVNASLGNHQRALDYLDKALAVWSEIGDRAAEAFTFHNMGGVYIELNDPPKALDYLNRALVLSREVGNRREEASILRSMGHAYSLSGETQKALEHYDQALHLWQTVSDPRGEAMTRFAIARTERDRDNLDKARPHIEAALDIIESTRAKVASQELRTSYFATAQQNYELYIDLLLRLHQRQPSEGHNATALQASERAHARGLLELLAEARIDVQQGINPALKQREKATQTRISWIQSQLIQARSQAKPDQTKIAQLDEEWKKVESEREQLETEIRRKHPQYAEIQYPTPLSLEAIQGLLDERTVLLEYALGHEASFLFAVSQDDFLVARLPSASTISDSVTKLRQAISLKPTSDLSAYVTQASELYKTLIRPASKLLERKKELIIVPDGILHYLPFEVLLSSGGMKARRTPRRQLPYLVRDYAISYVPSASVLASLRRPLERPPTLVGCVVGRGFASQREATPPPQKMFLAYADPVYDQREPEATSPIGLVVRSVFGEGTPWKLRRLQYSRQEVQRIAALYPKGEVDLHLGQDATEEHVKTEGRLSHYRFIHFAAHGLLNENKPPYSGIVLTLPQKKDSRPKTQDRQTQQHRQVPLMNNKPRTKDPVEDGLLQVYEIFNLKLNADLVVLSACETGLGKEVKGEGLIGLTRAFLYAGTPLVVVSLWKVEDRSTAELMTQFYRHLKDGQRSKADALRQAQLELIRAGAHPYFWAPFVLVGQPQVNSPSAVGH